MLRYPCTMRQRSETDVRGDDLSVLSCVCVPFLLLALAVYAARVLAVYAVRVSAVYAARVSAVYAARVSAVYLVTASNRCAKFTRSMFFTIVLYVCMFF